METLLIHRSVLKSHLPFIAQGLAPFGVTLHCDPESLSTLLPLFPSSSSTSSKTFPPPPSLHLIPITPSSYRTEWLGMEMSVRVVSSLGDAIQHIHDFGSGHTEVILTESKESCEIFLQSVDSAGVFWNASSRFADGYRYGFGAEIGVRKTFLLLIWDMRNQNGGRQLKKRIPIFCLGVHQQNACSRSCWTRWTCYLQVPTSFGIFQWKYGGGLWTDK